MAENNPQRYHLEGVRERRIHKFNVNGFDYKLVQELYYVLESKYFFMLFFYQVPS